MLCAAVGGGGASQYGKTPIRDELGLNDPDNLAVGSSRQAERARQARMNSELRSGLAGLPKPQNEYEIRVPEAAEEGDEDMAEPMEEDAADVAARRKAVQKAREEAELRKRSQVLQQFLLESVAHQTTNDAALSHVMSILRAPLHHRIDQFTNLAEECC